MTKKRTAGLMLSWAARQHRGRTALIFGDDCLTYDDMEAGSNRLAHALISLGLHVGERVAVLLNNSPEAIESVFAVEKAGLVYVALNARHTLAEQVAILNDADASVLVAGPEFREIGEGVRDEVASLRHVIGLDWQAPHVLDYRQVLASMPTHAPNVQVSADTQLRIAYTSGTTGKPKGVTYTVKRWYERLTNHFYAMEYGLGVDDAMLHVGPLTHAAGVHLLPCYLRGTRNVILEKFEPLETLQQIERHRITQMMCVPTMLTRLLDTLDSGVEADLSSLKCIHYGTAPTSVDLIRRAIARFGPVMRQQYGMTEAVQPLAVLYPHEHAEDGVLRSCGKPTANVQITVRDVHGQELAAGEIGEIAIATDGIGEVAFWRRPDLEAEAIRDGWYYTGDLGYLDAQGFLFIVGRNKDMIISGGFNVYAREVEDALESHPQVVEVAVLGLPDAEWGERIAAFVVRREGATVDSEALGSHCVALIAGYKKPRLIEFVDALPRNNAGKVVKNILRDDYLARLERTSS
ncbi:class I adenylate-forming enzyme family protein [Pseudomonas sp. NPDC099000]|uniref:class I adenylate-forming enzyme family protein n=1 Tax=Pseudomonas sp. NPDC099000 TaxID=3364488 RepID=UPI00383A05C3